MKTKHVIFSVTTDNKFLPDGYIENLERTLDPKQYRRMVLGEWLEITQDVIYYCYDRSRNFLDKKYEPDPSLPIIISHDFNIGMGKPMSAIIAQYDKARDEYHCFDEVIIEGARTADIYDELMGRRVFELGTHFLIHGDATGKRRDTRSRASDYDIIKDFLSNTKLSDGKTISYEIQVPKANPPIRTRHNLVNAYLLNQQGQSRLFIYKDAKTVDEGLRLAQLKKGGQYLEDDSLASQHCTTALGYSLFRVTRPERKSSQH